jgi:hypothetical protein
MSLNVENIPSSKIAETNMDFEMLLQTNIYRDENNGLKIVTFFKNSVIYGSNLSHHSMCSILLI